MLLPIQFQPNLQGFPQIFLRLFHSTLLPIERSQVVIGAGHIVMRISIQLIIYLQCCFDIINSFIKMPELPITIGS